MSTRLVLIAVSDAVPSRVPIPSDGIVLGRANTGSHKGAQSKMVSRRMLIIRPIPLLDDRASVEAIGANPIRVGSKSLAKGRRARVLRVNEFLELDGVVRRHVFVLGNRVDLLVRQVEILHAIA